MKRQFRGAGASVEKLYELKKKKIDVLTNFLSKMLKAMKIRNVEIKDE